mmetsp:Transcript_27658/g.66484  ORF Transcript_27658/g.66484 Transcript_27658/m.66484 type:complete len:619 (+) Transcript_27658:338-2194(+)
MAQQGYCQPSSSTSSTSFDYTEVRIEIQNWESSTFVTYIMQILLSEMLGVPTSVETSFVEYKANLYDSWLRLDYGWAEDERAMNRSSRHGDCVPFTTKGIKPGKTSSGTQKEIKDEINYPGYLACAHVISESHAADDWTPPFISKGILEPVSPLGALSQSGWYIPLSTLKEDPSLLHWTGLAGSSNRQKLAKMFKRPVEFKEYCETVSTTNCTEPDFYAQRYPTSHEDWRRYFVPGVYKGYFHYTEDNNCTTTTIEGANEESVVCSGTGHIVDYPCGWTSYTEPQTHHLSIALKSNGPDKPVGGYSVELQQDIWRAANATGEHVIMQVREPNALVDEFLGSSYSFERVKLPEPTQQCVDDRRPIKDRCSSLVEKRLGSPEGACDTPPQPVHKIFSTALYEISKGASIRPELHSPAYDALRAFSLSELRIDEMFDYYNSLPYDDSKTKKHFGLRDTACQWAAENIQLLESFIPQSYPRSMEDGKPSKGLTITSLTTSSIAIIGVAVTTFGVRVYRRKKVFVLSQIDFIHLILVGLLLIAIGALLGGIPTVSSPICNAMIWLIGLGYTLTLVPLIVKQAAINRIVAASTRMRRLRVSKRRLFGIVTLITCLEVIFLSLWT